MNSIESRILELIYENGPLGDHAIAPKIVDQWNAEDVRPHTLSLSDSGLVEESAFAPGRWQITDQGRRALGHEPGR